MTTRYNSSLLDLVFQNMCYRVTYTKFHHFGFIVLIYMLINILITDITKYIQKRKEGPFQLVWSLGRLACRFTHALVTACCEKQMLFWSPCRYMPSCLPAAEHGDKNNIFLCQRRHSLPFAFVWRRSVTNFLTVAFYNSMILVDPCCQ